jgi:uncharacterized membrane protein YcaP (DUF421 family)
MFFGSWDNLYRILLVGTLAYIGLLLLLRISGNRTLSKMNSFDLVITIAFGSALSTLLTSKDVPLMEGMTAIALLVLLQFIITWLAVRSKPVSKVVKTRPTLVMKSGEFLHDAMKTVRVTEGEMRTAMRQHGLGAAEQVAAIVMETDGSLSVISTEKAQSMSALEGVQGWGPEKGNR